MAFEAGLGVVSVPLPNRKIWDSGVSKAVGMLMLWYAQPIGATAMTVPTTRSRRNAV
jgi:hypothetical protein